MESVFYGLNNENMNRKDLIQRVMKVAEHYKNGDLYATGAMTDIGILVDEYTETVVKNCSIPAVISSVCTCEMPAKVKGKNECWRCKRPLKEFLQSDR